jgi:tetratricopeptide (TPR) repeat protein
VFLSNLLIQLKRPEEALETMALALKYHPDEVRILYHQAEVLMCNAKEKEALIFAQQALSKDFAILTTIEDELPRLSLNTEFRRLIDLYNNEL